MSKGVLLGATVAALALGLATRPARADFSACASAIEAKDIHQQIDLYTICLKRGGLVDTDVAGAFTNRGDDYWRLGEIDKALQDFTWAIQYDPNWPVAYEARARILASRGQCPQALADLRVAVRLAPRHPDVLASKAQVDAACPAPAKPPG